MGRRAPLWCWLAPGGVVHIPYTSCLDKRLATSTMYSAMNHLISHVPDILESPRGPAECSPLTLTRPCFTLTRPHLTFTSPPSPLTTWSPPSHYPPLASSPSHPPPDVLHHSEYDECYQRRGHDAPNLQGLPTPSLTDRSVATMPGRRMRRVCTRTLVHYEHANSQGTTGLVREEDGTVGE